MEKLYYHPFIAKIFHTLVYCLQSSLSDCGSVLDLGCGPDSPLQYCQGISQSTGVEAFKPYLDQSRKKKIHTLYILKEIEKVDFPPNSFDAVIIIEVLEHLPKGQGRKILKKAESWAKKKIIVSTPNGYFPMKNVDANRWQNHNSGWSIDNFEKTGFKIRGLAGIKYFYSMVNQVKSMTDNSKENNYQNIRFNPKKMFYIINSLCQIFSYYFPKFSFELFAVKKLNKGF